MSDSLKILPIPPDSLGSAITETIHTVRSMTLSELWHIVLDDVTKWGLKVLAAIAIYIVGRWLISRLKKVLRSIFLKRKIEPSLATFTISFANISLTVLLFVMIVSILGVPTSTFAALLAAGGMAIGMALSGTLQNFAGGIMILLFKPFKVGDFIETSGYSGSVDAINITNTQIRTADNRIVFMPNGVVASNNVMNYSMEPTRRATWKISISYGDDAGKAIELLLELMKKEPRIMRNPAPYAALAELGDSAIVMIVYAWVKSEEYHEVHHDMNKVIYEELPKAGMHFPFPQLEVTVKN